MITCGRFHSWRLTRAFEALVAALTKSRGLIAVTDDDDGVFEESREDSVRNNPEWQMRKCREKRALSVREEVIFLGKTFFKYSAHRST